MGFHVMIKLINKNDIIVMPYLFIRAGSEHALASKVIKKIQPQKKCLENTLNNRGARIKKKIETEFSLVICLQ